MANAIKKISLQRGYDVSEYTLCCFGGAGGQHACLIADALGMKQVFIHPYAGPVAIATVQMYTAGEWWNTPVYQREDLQPGDSVSGPAIIVEATGTNVIEPHWQVELTARNHLILKRVAVVQSKSQNLAFNSQNRPDPVMLEIFNNLFRAIAEQMGITLQNTSSSVNIKERLDFSCAIFDGYGQLVANAPHIPVHLGSMSESVQALIATYGDTMLGV